MNSTIFVLFSLCFLNTANWKAYTYAKSNQRQKYAEFYTEYACFVLHAHWYYTVRKYPKANHGALQRHQRKKKNAPFRFIHKYARVVFPLILLSLFEPCAFIYIHTRSSKCLMASCLPVAMHNAHCTLSHAQCAYTTCLWTSLRTAPITRI